MLTAFTLVNSWILEYLEASSAAWLMSTICFRWKVVSIMSEHTCTDQQVIFWVTTAQWTVDANWSWQTASGVLGSAKCGGACEFLLCLSLYMRERREISKKHWETERRGERVGEKWGKQTSEADKYENAKEWETAFFNYYLLSHNPIGKFIVVPSKNTHCVNTMGNTKH